jgi:hypothetical protein
MLTQLSAIDLPYNRQAVWCKVIAQISEAAMSHPLPPLIEANQPVISEMEELRNYLDGLVRQSAMPLATS